MRLLYGSCDLWCSVVMPLYVAVVALVRAPSAVLGPGRVRRREGNGRAGYRTVLQGNYPTPRWRTESPDGAGQRSGTPT